MHLNNNRGFSLLEAVLLIAVIVGIAGVVVPILGSEVSDAKVSRALDDTSRLSGAWAAAARLTKTSPGRDDEGMPSTALLTLGAQPGGLPLGRVRPLAQVFAECEKTIKATNSEYDPEVPLLGEVGADPWGRAYAILIPPFKTPGHVWALSAGMDGVLQTSERDSELKGDDIGVCVR